MKIGICSFSFHRLLAAGKMDMFQYIRTCKELGCTQLDPWNAHLADLTGGDEVLTAGRNPSRSHHYLSAADEDYIDRVRTAADDAGLPFGTIAVDGAHIYDPSDEARRENRTKAYRWLDIAHKLGATQVRIDAGGPEEMPDDVFKIIVAGYRDLIDRARSLGIEILIENHWGPSKIPANIERLISAIDGLGLLFDTRNWKPEHREEAFTRCAPFARAVHVKTLEWDPNGNEVGADALQSARRLQRAGYQGVWGIESVPADGDEIPAAAKSIALLHRI